MCSLCYRYSNVLFPKVNQAATNKYIRIPINNISNKQRTALTEIQNTQEIKHAFESKVDWRHTH